MFVADGRCAEIGLAEFLRDHLKIMELMARHGTLFSARDAGRHGRHKSLPPNQLVAIHAVTARKGLRLSKVQPSGNASSPRRILSHWAP